MVLCKWDVFCKNVAPKVKIWQKHETMRCKFEKLNAVTKFLLEFTKQGNHGGRSI